MSKNKYPKLKIIAIALIFFCSVVVSNKLMNGNLSAKKISFVILTFSALGIYAISDVFKLKREKFTWKIFDTAILIYTFYTLFSHFYIAQNYFVSESLVCFLSYIVFYFLIRLLFEQKELKNTISNLLVKTLLFVFSIQVFVGLLQFYKITPSLNPYFRVTGLFGNPAYLAVFLVSIFPLTLAIYLFCGKEKGVDKVLKYLSLFVGGGTILLLPGTESRTSWVAFLTGSFVVLNYKFGIISSIKKVIHTPLKKIVFYTVCLSLVVTLFITLYFLKPDSAFGRLFIWEVSLEMFKKQPFFGLGYEAFHDSYNNFQSNWFQENVQNSTFTKKSAVSGSVVFAYNEFIKLLVEKGILGFLIVLAMIGMLFKPKYFSSKWNENNEEKDNWIEIAIFGCLISLFFSGQFGYPSSIISVTLVFMFLLATLVSIKKNVTLFRWKKTKDIECSNLYLKVSRSIIFIISIGVICYQLNIIKSYKEWKIAAYFTKNGSYEKSLPFYKKSFDNLKNNSDFLQYYGNALYNTGNIGKSIALLEKAKKNNADIYLYTILGECYQKNKNYKLAESHYIHAKYMIPSMFYPRYLLAKLYDEMGDSKKALNTAEEIMIKKIKVKSQAITEIKTEMAKLIKKINTKDI